MRKWSTFGAFGDTVVELTWRDLITLVLCGELDLGCSVVISRGKSKRKALGQAPSREHQLASR